MQAPPGGPETLKTSQGGSGPQEGEGWGRRAAADWKLGKLTPGDQETEGCCRVQGAQPAGGAGPLPEPWARPAEQQQPALGLTTLWSQGGRAPSHLRLQLPTPRGQGGTGSMREAGRWGEGLPVFLVRKRAQIRQELAQGHTAISGWAGPDSQVGSRVIPAGQEAGRCSPLPAAPAAP